MHVSKIDEWACQLEINWNGDVSVNKNGVSRIIMIFAVASNMKSTE